MKIVFKHGKKKPEATVADGTAFVKLYAVPKEYSSDGYAVSAWGNGEIEPVPACAGYEATVLFSGKIESQGEGVSLVCLAAASNVTATLED